MGLGGWTRLNFYTPLLAQSLAHMLDEASLCLKTQFVTALSPWLLLSSVDSSFRILSPKGTNFSRDIWYTLWPAFLKVHILCNCGAWQCWNQGFYIGVNLLTKARGLLSSASSQMPFSGSTPGLLVTSTWHVFWASSHPSFFSWLWHLPRILLSLFHRMSQGLSVTFYSVGII